MYEDPSGYACDKDVLGKSDALLKEYNRLVKKYGKGSVREMEDGKYKFYGEFKKARQEGEMAGARPVREWDPVTGRKRDWYETLDRSRKIR